MKSKTKEGIKKDANVMPFACDQRSSPKCCFSYRETGLEHERGNNESTGLEAGALTRLFMQMKKCYCVLKYF